ncbi:hypothetical protein [Streptomyces mirabilis]|uniref:hypothetical protein n=1 Tax=Streptomyces mirabilis TaxID=68239 RepID=UPI0033E64E88
MASGRVRDRTGPDGAVARELDEVALPAWRRGASSGAGARAADETAVIDRRRVAASTAVAGLIGADELSPHPGGRSRRLVEAAYLASTAGHLEVPRLLADHGQDPDTPTGLVFAATAHLLTHDEGDVDAAHRLLVRALDARHRRERPLGPLRHPVAPLLVSLYTLSPEPWQFLGTAMAQFEPAAATPFRLCHLALQGRAAGGGVASDDFGSPVHQREQP